jgi:hypothetical protein
MQRGGAGGGGWGGDAAPYGDTILVCRCVTLRSQMRILRNILSLVTWADLEQVFEMHVLPTTTTSSMFMFVLLYLI